MSKSLEYLYLEIKVENYNLCRRTSIDKHKLICCFSDTFTHRLHSSNNSENYEQLNTIVDLISNFSKHLKTQNEKLNRTIDNVDNSKLENNFIFIKNLLEEILSKTKENLIQSNLKTLILNIKKIETELTDIKKLLNKIVYGQ